MKLENNKKYLGWGITIFLCAASIILFYYLIFHINSVISLVKGFFQIIMPIVDGFVLAYLLSPFVNFLENKVINDLLGKKVISNKRKKRIRFIAVAITLGVFILLLYKFLSMVFPEIATSINEISINFPIYMNNVEKWLTEQLNNNPEIEKFATNVFNNYSEEIDSWLNSNLVPQVNDFLIALTSGVFDVLKFIWNFLIGLIISVYLLCGKEDFVGQAKKCIYAFLKRDTANTFIHNIRFTHKTFIGFFLGKIVDSIIIGILCFILMSIIGIKYAVLISVIIGVTNVIPFFGPYIGAIPSAFIVLMVDPLQCFYFVIMIFLLQQFDGNILGPKILGESTGISGFWVIFSITLFGGMFGVLGMLVGVPVFAVIFASIKALVKGKLETKNLVGDTAQYVNVDYIDEENNFIKISSKEVDEIVSKKKNIASFFKLHQGQEKKNSTEESSSESENIGSNNKTTEKKE